MSPSAKEKQRLDHLVLERGLASTRSKAQALILAGEILVNGNQRTKVGESVSCRAKIELAHAGPRYVSRGGIKLAGALDHFKISPKGLICLDVGASTGGFTDCLLQRGAEHVYTIDVGRGQLDPKIRNHKRVTVREKFHVRELSPTLFAAPIDLATVDVSFISLRKVLPFVLPCLRSKGLLLALIKPQFEASPRDVRKGGVIRNEEKRQEILTSLSAFVTSLAFENVERAEACIPGPKGNREVFLKTRKP